MIVVGDRLFTAGIHAQSAATYLDWRNDYKALQYERIEPPASVAAGILEYCVELGLTYGSFDFVIRPDGNWLFLEFTDQGVCFVSSYCSSGGGSSYRLCTGRARRRRLGSTGRGEHR